jgi:hypothetical protein
MRELLLKIDVLGVLFAFMSCMIAAYFNTRDKPSNHYADIFIKIACCFLSISFITTISMVIFYM